MKQELAKLQRTNVPYRRRVPIELLLPDKEPDLLVPVSSRSFPEAQTPTLPDTSSTQSDAPQQGEQPPRKIGGGIFRPSGDHTIFQHVNLTPPSATPLQPNLPPDGQTKLPMTLFNFTTTWFSLTIALERWNLLASISPERLPTLFQASLDPVLLNSILTNFVDILPVHSDLKPAISRYMAAFGLVPRLSTVTLLFSDDERRTVRTLWDLLGEQPKWGL